MGLFGSYDIEALIGRGGMAEVYRARVVAGPRAGQAVAIKRIAPEKSADRRFVDLFLREAELSRHLKHPNVTEVYEAGSLDGVAFIAMELVEGRDLSRVVDRCHDRGIHLPIDFCCFLAWAAARGLHYAHTARSPDGSPLGVVHCDVNPSNLFVSRTGEVKVGDFGLAGAAKGRPKDGVFGKLHYLAPEQIEGKRVAPGTDVYGLGLTLYELLTGVRAFGGDTPEAVLRAIRRGAVPPPSTLRPEVPREVEALLLRAIAVKPRNRWRSAAELADALGATFDAQVGNPLAIAAVIRGLFETPAARPVRQRTSAPAEPRRLPLVRLLGELCRTRGSGVVVVRDAGVERALFVTRGQLLAATSNAAAERLGPFLVAEKLVSAWKIETLAKRAREEGRRLGDQLVFEGMLTPTQLAMALERQALTVFRNALPVREAAELRPPAPVNAVMHQAIGALVLDAFREGLGPKPEGLPGGTLALEDELVAELGLRPAEARTVRRLRAEKPEAVARSGVLAERVVQAFAALGWLD